MAYPADQFTVLIMKKPEDVDWSDIEANSDAFMASSGVISDASSKNEIGFGGNLVTGNITNATLTDSRQNVITMLGNSWDTTVFLDLLDDSDLGDYIVLIKPQPSHPDNLWTAADGGKGPALEKGGWPATGPTSAPVGLTDMQLWGYSIAGTLIGMGAAFLGALLILYMKDFKVLEQPLLWFSSGIIIAVSCLHLLGETGELNRNGWPHNSNLATCLVAGLFVGFMVEAIMKHCCGVTHLGHSGHVHGDPGHDLGTSGSKMSKNDRIKAALATGNDVEMVTSDGGDGLSGDVAYRSDSPSIKGMGEKEAGSAIEAQDTRYSVASTATDRNHEAISWTVIIADGLHNTFDGFIIAEAFDNCGTSKGWALAFAILVHELPQEMSDFYVLIKGGWSAKQAILANFAVSCSAIIGVIMYLGLKNDLTNHDFSFFLAFSTGGFLYIGIDLITHISPDATEHHPLVLFLCFWSGWAIIYALMEWHPECKVVDPLTGLTGHEGHNH